MKKTIKLLFIIFIISLSFLLVSCSDFNRAELNKEIDTELKASLTKINTIKAIDITLNINASASGNSENFSMRLVVKESGDTYNGYYKTENNGVSQEEEYCVDGYICTITNDYYEKYIVKQDDSESDEDFNFEEYFNNDFSDILNDIEYTLQREKADDSHTKYIINVLDLDLTQLADIFDEDIGLDFSNFTNFVIEVITDDNSGLLDSVNVAIGLVQNGIEVNVTMSLVVEAINDEVNFIIPQEVSDAINDYRNKNGEIFQVESEIPENLNINPIYRNTANGEAKYYIIGQYIKTVYDSNHNYLIAARENSIDVYNASTMEKVKTIDFLLDIDCLDTDKGILAIGFGNNNQIQIFDLSDFSKTETIDTNISVSDLVMDGNTIIYTDNDQWCDLVFYNISSKNCLIKNSVYEPKLTINRADHILYVCETNLSSSDIIYYQSQTGEQLFKSEFGMYEYNSKPVMFDGKYVHYFGKTFNRYSGFAYSSNELVKKYNNFENFKPYKTILESEKLSFVYGFENSKGVVSVYDNENDMFIYKFDYLPNVIQYIGNGKYYITDQRSYTLAIIDINVIDETLAGNIYEDKLENVVLNSEDGKMKFLYQSEIYTDSVKDYNYIYLLNKYSYELNIYDKSTLEIVNCYKFLSKPECIDAYGGKMVIGFGEKCEIWLYDTQTFDYEVINANSAVCFNGKYCFI